MALSNALNLMDAKRLCIVKTLNIMDANIKGFTVYSNAAEWKEGLSVYSNAAEWNRVVMYMAIQQSGNKVPVCTAMQQSGVRA